MATVVQQDTVQQFWQRQAQKHPNWYGALSTIWAALCFVLNGHVIVWAARWIIRWCGYVAESALLLAVLWISATSVAPGLLELVMDKSLIQRIVWLALIALALIPEVILGNAIISALNHWRIVRQDRRNVIAIIWAVLFSLSTLLFFVLTAITLNALTSNGGNFVQASTSMLGFRCFAGWIYGLLAIVYAGAGKHMVQEKLTSSQPVDYTQIMEQVSMQIQEKLNAHLAQIITQTQVNPDQDLPQSVEQTPPQSEANVAPDSAQNVDKTQGETDRETDPNLHAVSPKTRHQTRSTSSNKTYAITKREAALQCCCSLKDIEKGIEENRIKLYANTDKVLVSSLKNFASRRRLKVVNS